MRFRSTIDLHRSSPRPRRRACVIAIQTMVLATLLTSQSAFAIDKSWTGASSTVWATGTNWNPSAVPAAVDNALFGASFTNQPRLNASANVGGLWIKTGVTKSAVISAGSPGYALTLDGNTINGVAGRGILADNSSSYSLTVGCSTRLANNQIWQNNSHNLLTVNGAVDLNAKTLTVSGTGNTFINGIISSIGGTITKNGAGTLTLRGANTYTGITHVFGGTLLINGNQSSATGAVTISNSGSTLGGVGTSGGTVRVNSAANIAPGNGGNTSGILNTGAVTLASGANFVVHINGPTAGSEYSQLHVTTGAATITGSHLVLKIGAGLIVGQTFKILNKSATGAITGTFAQGNSIASGGYTFSVNYAGGDGNDIVLTVTATPIITTVVGSGARFFGNNGAATNAHLGQLAGLAFRGGNLYVCDIDHNIVVKIASGIATVVAGTGTVGFSGDGGPATSAALHKPRGLAFDASGNMYIADLGNNRIRKVTPGGMITTFAGCDTCDVSVTPVEGVFRTNTFITPTGIAISSGGNIYVSDVNHMRVRKIRTDGTVVTMAGNGSTGVSGDGGLAINASLGDPESLALDGSGNLYINDFSRLRKVTASNGTINTIAGPSGFSILRDLLLDGAGNVFVTDISNVVHRIATNGSITTVIGTGDYGFSGDGGPAISATFKNIWGIAQDTSGNIYVADQFNYRVRKVNTSGTITTFAGRGVGNFWGDGGSATSAGLDKPSSVAFDSLGNMYIADTFNNRVRKVTPGGIISTFAGTGVPNFSGDGGPATSAALNEPTSVAVDNLSNVYIADSQNNRIRKVAPGGTITTYAGNGTFDPLGDGGPATMAGLGGNLPGIATDSLGNLYIVDRGNARVRKVTASSGIITTVAGNGGITYTGDGGLATNASLQLVYSVSVGPDGSIYIGSEGSPAQLRRVKQGIITRFAGDLTGGRGCTCVDNPGTTRATNLTFETIINAAFNSNGSVFVGESNQMVTVVVPNNTIYYLVNNDPTGASGFSGDGGPALTALVQGPRGLATDAAGNLYIADQFNFRIRKVWLH